MVLHERVHPGLTETETCFACRIASVSISATATPSRKPETAATVAREERWARDMPAYRELRKQGTQPRTIDGCAELAAKAETVGEVETGHVLNRLQRKTVASLTADITGGVK